MGKLRRKPSGDSAGHSVVRHCSVAALQRTVPSAFKGRIGKIWTFLIFIFLLDFLGFGLYLNTCAISGKTEDLAYISPKTGRAVSRAVAQEWADRLFPFVPVLSGVENCDLDDLKMAFKILGYFLENHVLKGLGLKAFPVARARFVDVLSQNI